MDISEAIVNPYIGPRTFDRSDSGRFFGRERVARDLRDTLVFSDLVLFYAQSGAGKSSLINARVIPLLQERGFEILPIGRVGGEFPAGIANVDNIYVYSLMLSLEERGEDLGRFANTSLADYLLDQLATNDTIPETGEPPHRALIIDQFEEILIAHPEHWAERVDFFCQLGKAIELDPYLHILLLMREDYVAALDPYASLVPGRLRTRFYMERMGVDTALEAIRRPAELGGRPFATGVAEKLVDDLRQIRVPGQEVTVPGPSVEPVQLQVICYQLWERLRRAEGGGRQTAEAGQSAGGRFITETDLAEAGNVNQELEQFYIDTLAAVLADERVVAAKVSERALRTWFDMELLTETGIRNTVFRNESNGRTGSMPNPAVDALTQRFLLRTELRGGGAWVELVHDRFVEPIRANNAVWIPLHLSRWQLQAALWDEQGRSSALLLRDLSLVEAEAWTAAHPDELASHERDFLAACREAHQAAVREQRQSRRIRLLEVIAVGMSLIATIATVVAMIK